MSVSFENKETNRGLLTFSISQEKIKPALDRVFNSVKKRIAHTSLIRRFVLYYLTTRTL